jgi:cell division protein FtsQ
MARRQTAQLDLELPEETVQEPPEAPRHARAASEPKRARPARLRLWAGAAVLLLAVIAAGILYYHVDQFLASDPRFALAGAAALRIEGAVYVSPQRLGGVFAADLGRSVYLIPLEARRRGLLAVDWVEQARVTRHWPNRVAVRILERTPVAFLVLPAGAGGLARMALIDAAGVILEPPERARFALPVLLGVGREQPQAVRQQRVRLLLEFLREAGSSASQVSEMDASDPENLRATLLVEGRAVRVLMGSGNLRARLENFLGHYAEIHRWLPGAAAFDLRLEGRITVAEGAGRGR